jgi:hypothetical protein
MSTFRVKNSSDVIPVGTVLVVVENKKIERLPSLPKSLTKLTCYECMFLHELPSLLHCVDLTVLDCDGCTSLRKLPPLSLCVSLTWLDCFRCTSLRELPPLPVSLIRLNCSGCTYLLYLPTIPYTCEYRGPSLPTEETYFEQANMGANQEFVASRGDELLYVIIGKDITDVVKGYLS